MVGLWVGAVFAKISGICLNSLFANRSGLAFRCQDARTEASTIHANALLQPKPLRLRESTDQSIRLGWIVWTSNGEGSSQHVCQCKFRTREALEEEKNTKSKYKSIVVNSHSYSQRLRIRSFWPLRVPKLVQAHSPSLRMLHKENELENQYNVSSLCLPNKLSGNKTVAPIYGESYLSPRFLIILYALRFPVRSLMRTPWALD